MQPVYLFYNPTAGRYSQKAIREILTALENEGICAKSIAEIEELKQIQGKHVIFSGS